MGVFISNAITDRGRILLGEAQVGATFEATRIVMGSGYIPAGYTARTMTAVVAPVIELAINKKRRAGDGTVTFGGVYSNENITEAFYFREFALYARVEYADGTYSDEVLYSYGNAGDNADLMPAYSTSTVVEKQMDLVTWVGNDTVVNLSVTSGIYNPHAEKHAADGEDPLSPAMIGAVTSSVKTIEGDIALLDTALTPGHYLFLDANGYFGVERGLFDVYVSEQFYGGLLSVIQTAKRTYPTNDGIIWERYYYEHGGWTDWRKYSSADKSMATGNVLNIDSIPNEGVFNVMATAAGSFPPDLDKQPEETRHVGIIMHKVWDGNYAEQMFFSYATLGAYKRTLHNNVWTEWDDIITSRGGTMKSRLWLGNGVYNGYGGIASNQTEMHLTMFTDPTDSNSAYTNLVVNNGKDVPDGQRLRVSIDSMDGENSLRSYFLLHTGNAPAAIAAAELV